ncbi:MAG: hypothetical protein WKF77_29215 [Planctomycetaceae bacterium]
MNSGWCRSKNPPLAAATSHQSRYARCAREHSLIDHNGDHLLRAQLSNHRTCGGHVIPHTVKISFPPQKTELTLNFKGIEPNFRVADGLWAPPTGVEHVDMGDYVRSKYANIPSRKGVGPPIAQRPQNDTLLDGVPQRHEDALVEPEFDPRDMTDDSLFPDDSSPDDRYFGNEEPGDANAPFDNEDDDQSNSRGPIREAGFQEIPDFDIVAPKQPKRLWPGLKRRR